MGSTIALLTGKGLSTIDMTESVIIKKRNNLLIASIICVVIFIAISYDYMSKKWLWLTIPAFVIILGLLIPTQLGYMDLKTYTLPAQEMLEEAQLVGELSPI